MNRNVRLREDVKLASALRQQLEQWLVNTHPHLVQQVAQKLETNKRHHPSLK